MGDTLMPVLLPITKGLKGGVLASSPNRPGRQPRRSRCFCQRATVLIVFDGGLFRLFSGTRSRHLLLTFKKQLTCSILLNIASPTFMRVESVSKRYNISTAKQNLGNSRYEFQRINKKLIYLIEKFCRALSNITLIDF